MADLTFRPLGTLENKYYYYSFLLQRIIALSPIEHKKENLFNLAPLSHWKTKYGDKREGVQWDVAVDSLMQTCAHQELFNPANIIGRGIWLVNGESITHYGDMVLIGGVKYKPKDINNKLLFELSESLQLDKPDPEADFTKVSSVLGELNFQTPHASTLLSGWIVCAMAAGALHWRPHAWATGKSGRGKSAIVKVIKRLLRGCAEYYEGETTEAGIRQDMRHDCRAIVFDEAEPKTPSAMVKINGVLNLLRQASSNDSGKIAKGTTTGKGMNFKIKSCGFLASVNPYLKEEPDKNRFFIIEMGEPMEKAQYDLWEYRMENAFTPGFQAALHDRVSKNILTLHANAKTFARILAKRFNNNRAGDQYGTLLAGAYLLNSLHKLSEDEASDWVKDMKLPPEIESQPKSDEQDLWNFIIEQSVMFKKRGINTEAPMAELFDVACGISHSEDYATADAVKVLRNKGMKAVKIEGKCYIAVSTNHTAIAQMIYRSRFGDLDWSPILRRLPGSMSSKKPFRIGLEGELSKATIIPWRQNVTNEDDDEELGIHDLTRETAA